MPKLSEVMSGGQTATTELKQPKHTKLSQVIGEKSLPEDVQDPSIDIEIDSDPSIPEIAKHGYKIGKMQVSRGRLGAMAMFGDGPSEEFLPKLAEIESSAGEDITPAFRFSDPSSVAANVVSETAKLLPFMGESIKRSFEYGIKGAGAGGVAGNFIPGIGAISGATIGGRAGAALGIVKESLDIEGGNLYTDLIKDGVSHETARDIAIPVGVFIGLVESSQMGTIARRIPGFDKVLKKKMTDAVISNPTLRARLLKVGANYAKDIGEQIAQEEAQEIAQIGGEVLAKTIEKAKTGKEFKIPTWQNALERMGQVLKTSLITFPVLQAPGAIIDTSSAVRANKAAKKTTKSEIETKAAPKEVAPVSFDVDGRPEAEINQELSDLNFMVEDLKGRGEKVPESFVKRQKSLQKSLAQGETERTAQKAKEDKEKAFKEAEKRGKIVGIDAETGLPIIETKKNEAVETVSQTKAPSPKKPVVSETSANEVKTKPEIKAEKSLAEVFAETDKAKTEKRAQSEEKRGRFEEAGRHRKGAGMRRSSILRKLNGEPTGTELNAAIQHLNSNYIGKKVTTRQGDGVVSGPPAFGNIKIKLTDGNEKFFPSDDVSSPTAGKDEAIEYLKKQGEKEARSDLEIYGIKKEDQPKTLSQKNPAPERKSETKRTGGSVEKTKDGRYGIKSGEGFWEASAGFHDTEAEAQKSLENFRKKLLPTYEEYLSERSNYLKRNGLTENFTEEQNREEWENQIKSAAENGGYKFETPAPDQPSAKQAEAQDGPKATEESAASQTGRESKTGLDALGAMGNFYQQAFDALKAGKSEMVRGVPDQFYENLKKPYAEGKINSPEDIKALANEKPGSKAQSKGQPDSSKVERTRPESATANEPAPEPVKNQDGNKLESRAFERVKERYEAELDGQEAIYNKLNLAQDTAHAVRFVQEQPQAARRIALGIDPAPAGVTETAISIAYSEEMREAGNWKEFAETERSRSLRQTRRGQEISAERGRANENAADHFIQMVIKFRLLESSKKLFPAIASVRKETVSRASKVTESIKQQTGSLKKTISVKRLDMMEAQKILDSLRC